LEGLRQDSNEPGENPKGFLPVSKKTGFRTFMRFFTLPSKTKRLLKSLSTFPHFFNNLAGGGAPQSREHAVEQGRRSISPQRPEHSGKTEEACRYEI
jgi:hypothetical protein